MATKQRVLARAEWEAHLPHVFYEWHMFLATGTILTDLLPEHDVVRNALLEASSLMAAG